ncbi:MAG: exosortase/archaeosortase family protein [Phycisphaerales bacterium]|nr:exosortase/archaeosortase family protein [Phycisphaerales bacterium]
MSSLASPARIASMDEPRTLASLFTPDVTAKLILLTTAFCVFFWSFLETQTRISLKDADWSHALLIPLLSIYFIYVQREKLLRIKFRTFWPGLAIMVVGMIGYVLFTLVAVRNHTLQGGMAVLTLLGLVLMMLGPGSMRVLLFPIAYLVLGIKMGDRLMFYLTTELKMIAAKGSWLLLNTSGVETERTGSVLTLTKGDGTEIPLDVAEACSGMRMIVAFIALGIAIAFLSCKFWWQRVILVALAVPVAILVNILRVTSMGWLSLYDPNMAGGDFHMLVGMLWLLPALGLYLGIVWVLNRIVITEPIRAMAKKSA